MCAHAGYRALWRSLETATIGRSRAPPIPRYRMSAVILVVVIIGHCKRAVTSGPFGRRRVITRAGYVAPGPAALPRREASIAESGVGQRQCTCAPT